MQSLHEPLRGEKVRERLVYGVLVAILIMLFAFVFAILGRGEYEPSAGFLDIPAISQTLD